MRNWGQTGRARGKLQSVTRCRGHDAIKNEKWGVKFLKVAALTLLFL